MLPTLWLTQITTSLKWKILKLFQNGVWSVWTILASLFTLRYSEMNTCVKATFKFKFLCVMWNDLDALCSQQSFPKWGIFRPLFFAIGKNTGIRKANNILLNWPLLHQETQAKPARHNFIFPRLIIKKIVSNCTESITTVKLSHNYHFFRSRGIIDMFFVSRLGTNIYFLNSNTNTFLPAYPKYKYWKSI